MLSPTHFAAPFLMLPLALSARAAMAGWPNVLPQRPCCPGLLRVPSRAPPAPPTSPRSRALLHRANLGQEAGGPPPLHVAAVRGQGIMVHLLAIRGNLRVRMDPLVLPRHSYAADEPSPAEIGKLPRMICSKSTSRTSHRNSIKGKGRSANRRHI